MEPHGFLALPQTPGKGGIGKLLQQWSGKYDLHLPWNEEESPSRRRRSPEHEIVGAISFLYFQDRKALDTALDEFRTWFAKFGTSEKKVSYLLERLTIARASCVKNRTPRGSRQSSRARHSTRPADLPEPASPTLGVKHASSPSFEMPADNFQLPQPRTIRKASLKRPRSNESLTDKLRASRSHSQRSGNAATNAPRADPQLDASAPYPSLTTGSAMPPSSWTPSSAQKPTTTVNTSFASNGLTSFNASFWSEAQQGTQDPESPATSADDSFHTPDGKDASLGFDGANDVAVSQATNYGSPPQSQDCGPTQLRDCGPRHDVGVRQSDASEFGCSWESEFKEELLAMEDTTETVDTDERYDPQAQLPSPPDTEALPRRHQLTGPARVKNIPSDGLSSDELPAMFADLEYLLRWDTQRVLQTRRITADQLAEAWPLPRNADSLIKIVRSRDIQFEPSDKAPLADLSFTAIWRWTKSRQGPVFWLELLPARKDDANSLERGHGRDRFVKVNMPSFPCPPEVTGLHNIRYSIATHVRELLKRSQRLLGRRWRAILVQPRESRPNDVDLSAAGGIQVYFFAEQSDHASDAIQPKKYEIILDWWIRFAKNGETSQSKAYARLDLGVSRTRSVQTLDAEDVEYGVKDKMPTKDRDNTEFDDPKLPNPMIMSSEPMSDGCNRISSRIMRSVQATYDLPYLPSVVQARVFGAKGLWHRDNDDDDVYNDSELPTRKKAITIGESQVKIWQAPEDFSDLEKLTLNVNNFNRPPQPAIMYTSFLPILVDRNVPWQAIAEAARKGIEGVTQELLTALHDRAELQQWIYSKSKSKGAIDTEGGDVSEDFPFSKEDRILRMLQAGFDPTTCKHLAEKVSMIVELFIKGFRKKTRIPIPKSTMLYGICDPCHVVEPGTIHVGFLNSFNDGDRQLNALRGPALVGRLPALGSTDIQKVRCVYYPRLAHLTDVAVFPARGPRSLASKLQGGDYDGDQFVIIWEPTLVRPFLNAPVQADADPPETFGIVQSKMKLKNVVPTDEQGSFQDEDVANWLDQNFEKQLRFDWVGMVTNTYDSLVYHEGGLDSPAAQALRQLHDHVIDAPKRGYTFDHAAWDRFCKKHNLKAMQSPAYKRYVKDDEDDSSGIQPKRDNIVDHILFEKVEPVLQDALKQAKDIMARASTRDDQLNTVYSQNRKQHRMGSVGRNELDSLLSKFQDLKRSWDTWVVEYRESKKNKTRAWRTVVDKARQHFKDIEPDNPGAEIVKGWMTKTGEGWTTWDLLKASALSAWGASASLMFEAAGCELCVIKGMAVKDAQVVRPEMMRKLKPRPLKRKADSELEPREQEGLRARATDGQDAD